MPSACTVKAARAYFRNGTLPDVNTKCDVTVSLFSGESGWGEVLKELEE